MGEPAVGAATPERDFLLGTKLNVPGLRPDLVPRPRLEQRLDESQGRGLILACAPAGYGKTVLLADWVRRGRRPVAWLSLDAGDNDPVRFWRHTVAALDRVRPGISERLVPLLGPPPPPSFEPLVTALINEVADQPDPDAPLLLVLDDYHVISSLLVHESLGFLLEHRPPGLRLALTSRSDPPLALARLRARGQLTELRAADLRFTPDEAAVLLAQVTAAPGEARPEAPLPDTIAAALAARTEGWAAGLQLAALSLRGQPDAAGFTAAFTGSHRHILDFLTEEVLEQQPDRQREFLLETSVLERLSGQLCDAVTGRPGSQARLEQIERAGLFLVPLDEVRGWWRYHHLFADLLRARLQQEAPERAAELHRRAAGWYAEQGLPDEAIRHAVAAGEMTWAARLIEQHFDAAHSLRGEAATVRRWLAPLPADLVRSRPRLLLAQAVPAAVGGRLEEAEQLVEAAERAPAGTGAEPFEPTIGRAGSLLVNVPALIALARGFLAQLHGDARGTAGFGSRALAESEPDQWILRSVAHGQLAVAGWLDGHLAEAERGFADSIAGRRAVGLPTWEAWASFELAQVQLAQGRLDAAERTGQQALDAVAGADLGSLPAAGPAHVGLAGVAFQRNDVDRARENLAQGIALCRSFVYAMPLAMGLATLAWVRQADGDAAGARAAMDEAVQGTPGPPGVLNPIPALWARLVLAQGDLAAAVRWTQEHGLHEDDPADYAREPAQLVLARVLLAQGRPGPALALLERLYTAAAGQDRAGSLIEIGVLRALARAAAGDADRALQALAEALTLACPQGYVRIFADEGAPMAALLAQLSAAQRPGDTNTNVPGGYLSQLQRALGAPATVPDPGRAGVPAVPGLIDQLTRRELEVLEMLAAGRSNQAIASGLVVTLDTVKKHVSHIRGKLGAANRTEAVARARDLGLIP
ncbi:MAG TPA: LuxR C-terminal-related transcriptional regulator [Streptosporangiaceae bacterium]